MSSKISERTLESLRPLKSRHLTHNCTYLNVSEFPPLGLQYTHDVQHTGELETVLSSVY